MIAWKWLSTSRGKTYNKNFGDPKLGPNYFFWLFSQGFIIISPRYCTGLQLGTIVNIW